MRFCPAMVKVRNSHSRVAAERGSEDLRRQRGNGVGHEDFAALACNSESVVQRPGFCRALCTSVIWGSRDDGAKSAAKQLVEIVHITLPSFP